MQCYITWDPLSLIYFSILSLFPCVCSPAWRCWESGESCCCRRGVGYFWVTYLGAKAGRCTAITPSCSCFYSLMLFLSLGKWFLQILQTAELNFYFAVFWIATLWIIPFCCKCRECLAYKVFTACENVFLCVLGECSWFCCWAQALSKMAMINPTGDWEI